MNWTRRHEYFLRMRERRAPHSRLRDKFRPDARDGISGKRQCRASQAKRSFLSIPGYKFSAVDALITNFHLPRSTPLMLVAAFMGTDGLKKAYEEAISGGYRFYSYGDAMFIS